MPPRIDFDVTDVGRLPFLKPNRALVFEDLYTFDVIFTIPDLMRAAWEGGRVGWWAMDLMNGLCKTTVYY